MAWHSKPAIHGLIAIVIRNRLCAANSIYLEISWTICLSICTPLDLITFIDLLHPFWNHRLSLQSDWLSAVRFLLPNRTIFCSKSHLFFQPMRMRQKNKATNEISRFFQTNQSHCMKMKFGNFCCQNFAKLSLKNWMNLITYSIVMPGWKSTLPWVISKFQRRFWWLFWRHFFTICWRSSVWPESRKTEPNDENNSTQATNEVDVSRFL